MASRRSALLSLVVVMACAGKGGHGAGGRTGDYPALAFVPADASYALASTRVDQAVVVLDDLADGLGLLDGEDAASLGPDLARGLGFDPLSIDSLAEQGVDPTRGLAVWAGADLGPTLALPLADPARVAALIEGYRQGGVVVQTSRLGGHEVSTWRPERDVAVHWTFVDDWLLVHVELADAGEVDGAWLTQALAAHGGFAAGPDFARARGFGGAQLGGTPTVIGVARVPAILGSRLGAQLRGCAATLGQIGQVSVAAGSDGAVVRGAVTIDVPAGLAGVAAMQLAAPAGWVAARGAPPLAVEVGVDLRQLQAALAPCIGTGLTEEPIAAGLFGGRAYAYQLDVGEREVRGGFAGRVGPRVVADVVDEIPGYDFLKHTRTVAGRTVTELDVPMLPALAFTQTGEELVATLGTPIAPLLEGTVDVGTQPAPVELGRVEVRPTAWTAAQWDSVLEPLVERDQLRTRMVAGLRRWQLAVIEAHRDDRAIVITARAERAR